jgi:arginine exporter protein ArgO
VQAQHSSLPSVHKTFVLRQGFVKQHVGKIVAICALSDAILVAAVMLSLANILIYN